MILNHGSNHGFNLKFKHYAQLYPSKRATRDFITRQRLIKNIARAYHKIHGLTQITRDVGPMLGQSCPSFYDAGPTLTQHWTNVSCLLVSTDMVAP